MTKRVWIAQCLCPMRHCILAAANEADGATEAEELITQLREAVNAALARARSKKRRQPSNSTSDAAR